MQRAELSLAFLSYGIPNGEDTVSLRRGCFFNALSCIVLG
jgi:hypothetical protein